MEAAVQASRIQPSCRICLTESSSRKNPFLDPCACNGSIKYVHFRCLQKWRITDPSRTMERCTMCKGIYQLPCELKGEVIPSLGYFHPLENLEFYSILFFYIILLTIPQQTGVTTFKQQAQTMKLLCTEFSVVIQSFWTVFAYTYLDVSDREFYRTAWLESNRIWPLILQMLIWISYLSGSSQQIFLILPFSLDLLWKTHVEILQERNRQLQDQLFSET
jgi:RING-variant domain